MKFDPLKWNEISSGTNYPCERGMIRLNSTHPMNVFVLLEGVEALAYSGQSCDIRVGYGCEYRAETEGSDVRVFSAEPANVAHEQKGEIYTNIDRKPHESGTVAEVRRELRRHQLEQNMYRRVLQAEQAELAARKKVLDDAKTEIKKVETKPKPDPKPEDKSEEKAEEKPET